MKKVNNLIKIIAKIAEIGHWVAAGLMAAVAVCSAAAPQWLKYFIDIYTLEEEAQISVYGFEVAAPPSAGGVNFTALGLFGVGAVIILSLMAMIFRNLFLIIKKSEGTTPFQKDNIRMLKEISIFSISVPFVGLIMSGVMRLVLGASAVETSVAFDGFITGLLILCLTQYFAHGLELENDVNGLL